MNICKVARTSRLVFSVSIFSPRSFSHRICLDYSKQGLPSRFDTRKMSQKSITSFFKRTPKKEVEVNENDENQEKLNKNISMTTNKSPEINEKRSSKRLRSESIENTSPNESRSSSPTTSEKKKKVKRQRIESSESEGNECNKSTEELMPIKTEKKSPKTYNSPKSKQKAPKIESPNKGKVESRRNSETKTPDEGIKVKNEEKSSSPKENDSPSPKIKKGPKKKTKENKNTMSAFLKKESVSPKDSTPDKQGDDVEKSGLEQTIIAEVDYNPGKAKYHPINDACWKKGEKVPYLALAKTLEIIEATSARLKMVEILSNYFRSVITLTPEDLLPSIYLCLNQLAPAYVGLELGIAETYLMKAVGQCTGRSVAQVRSAAQKCGDLGSAAQQARATQRTMFAPPPLAVRAVLAALRDVAAMTGQASVNKKIGKIQSLYVACRHSEAKYLIRSLEGKLRVGLAEQSLLQALALAAARTPPAGPRAHELDVAALLGPDQFKAELEEQALIVKSTYCECPDYERLVGALLQHGVAALPQHCRLTVGLPLKPMLAQPTRAVREVLQRFEGRRFTCEWKYDGERAQIHVPGEDAPRFHDASIFSRNQENNTSKYPDVIRRLPALLGPAVRSCVLDCEAVAFEAGSGRILPFQVLATRKRKDADADAVAVQVCVFLFDLLLLNGRSLVHEPLEARRRLLRDNFAEVPGEWQFAESRDCTTMEEVQQFLEESIQGSCEGLMVKMLTGENSKYDIARRSHNWLKLKKDYLEGAGDSIDAVVIGAYLGRGRRAGLYGGFLLACRDAAAERFQSLCKLGTGFSEQQLRELSEALQRHRLAAPRAYYSCSAALAPDHWLEAACVWELRCADLSLSPAHHAALGLLDPHRGVSLRFPRFVRVREDKTPEQATTAEQIAQMYLAQDQVKNQPKKLIDDDEFY